MEYIIKKAKIKDMTLTVEMEEIIYPENASPITNDVTKKSDQLIHPDLRAAFDKLIPHLVLICEQKEETLMKGLLLNGATLDTIKLEDLSHVNVTGFVIGGSNEHLGVTLIGSKTVDCGVLNLISPFTKYESDYKYGNDLSIAIDACVYEVEQYLFQGKCAVKQMELPFDGEDETSGMTVTMIDNEGKESKPIDFEKVSKRLKKVAGESV